MCGLTSQSADALVKPKIRPSLLPDRFAIILPATECYHPFTAAQLHCSLSDAYVYDRLIYRVGQKLSNFEFFVADFVQSLLDHSVAALLTCITSML